MCLIHRLEEFEGQGQRSRSLGTNKLHFSALKAACVRFMFGKSTLASGFCSLSYVLDDITLLRTEMDVIQATIVAELQLVLTTKKLLMMINLGLYIY